MVIAVMGVIENEYDTIVIMMGMGHNSGDYNGDNDGSGNSHMTTMAIVQQQITVLAMTTMVTVASIAIIRYS